VGGRAVVRVGLLLAAWPALAAAAEREPLDPCASPRVLAPRGVTPRPAATKLPGADRAAYLFAAVAFGRGLRFNNPYRLQTQLGDSGESLSLTAPYADLSVGATLGRTTGAQHGAWVHWSAALAGVVQDVITPSYVVLLRVTPRWLTYGRVGTALVLRPDPTGGGELGAGAVWFVTAGIGVTAELVGSVFYGAATAERSLTTIPLLALQAGALVGYEVLP
jgi:hypothetical protein